MATIEELEKLARKITGKDIKVQRGGEAFTDGASISVIDPKACWPDLPPSAIDDIDRFQTAHEARHIVVFAAEAKKRNLPGMTSVEFYRIFADPQSPGAESTDYVRFLLNIVEDQLIDNAAAKDVGEKRRTNVNGFFVWARQGGVRPSLAEYESQGNPGRCAAFVEALFQFAVFGRLIETFASAALESAAKEAVKARELFGKGTISRTEALRRTIAALKKYCPPPWTLPQDYEPPRGESPTGEEGGGQGSGAGAGQKPGKGQKGKGQPGQKAEGQGEGEGSGEGDGEGSGEGSGDGDGQGQGKGKGKGKGKGQGEASDGDAEGEGEPAEQPSDGDPADADSQDGDAKDGEEKEEGSESPGGGKSSPSDSVDRGTGTGEGAGAGKSVQAIKDDRFEDEDAEALLRTLERVLAERTKDHGRGHPVWRTWAPGDRIQAPDEVQRFWEDETFGIDPLERRAVRQRTLKRHLLAIFIDSSGSVSDGLFAMLYKVVSMLAEKIADLEGCYLGVGQFSGGASWVLEPTRNVDEIRDMAEQTPVRLYSGSTVVGEIYKVIPTFFAEYETADLIVLTDGGVESGPELVKSLHEAHDETSCEIKLHGVIFRAGSTGFSTTTRAFDKAKDEEPRYVRVWELGKKAA